jgi:excisionase family DNA binding protein
MPQGPRTVTHVSTADIEWLNTAETARRLGVTPRTLYRFIDEGQLPAYRFGRVIRLKESEVAEFIERCRIVPGSLDTRDGDDPDLDAASLEDAADV